MRKNIVLCGVGGQGTVLASKLIAAASIIEGYPVMSAETIGMAQRGGSVFSNLRIGEGVHSPMIADHTADLIIGFEPGEAVRMLHFLKPDGVVVTNKKTVVPTSASLTGFVYEADVMIDYLKSHCGKLVVVDGDAAAEKLGSPKILNTVLLGAAYRSGVLGLSKDSIKRAMSNHIKEKLLPLNLEAFSYEN
ncbi:MAG: pyruvate ferredoxin oxidoreductase [Lachnospiraceae bacterium]|jgi:indolepyruvate ferredoxin oxidoreductase beta subunit|nr:pyruvate ferredoxin oxidoreductase [Lachnospiraceae bacterium]